MANLGALFYELHIKNLTDQELQEVEKKLKNLGIELDTKKLTESLKKSVESYKGKDLSLGVKTQFLHDAIRAALKQPEFPIKVTVNKAEAQDAVREALRRAGLQQGFTASDKRQYDAETKRLAAMTKAQAAAAASNALAQQRLARAHNTAASAASGHTKATVSLNSALRGNLTITKELGGAIGAAYSVVALKNFMTKVVEIGGELEQQKLAMKAILGDEGMANTISSQINTLAVKSPFGIMELNQYAKQLTAYQIPYNELYDTMKRLADISAATGTEMSRVILAYGQIRAATVLKGTEARQLTEANIPIYDMLSNYYTKLEGQMVSVGEVMDRISNKEVPFQDVKNVLWELTNEGGKFYNMQEVLSESVKAKWKNLSDAIDLMFAEIADSTSGPLKWTAEMLTTLAANWEKIGAVLAANIAIFGSYKVTQLALNRAIGVGVTNTLKSAQSLKQKAAETLRLEALTRKLTDKEKGLIATSQKLTAADYVNLASTKQLTKQKALLLIGLRRLDTNSIGHIAKILNISKAEIKATQSTKKWILQAKLLGTSLKNAFVSIGSAILNPMTAIMAAVSAGTYLWQRHSEQASQAKEFGDNMFTAAVEQGKNLREVIKGIGTDIQNLDEAALRQTYEKLATTIKDYAPNGEKILIDTKFDAQGNRRTLREQTEELQRQITLMEQASALAEKIQVNTILENAEKANSGVFDDNWKEDIKDLSEAYGKATMQVTKFAQAHPQMARSMVDTAIKEDEAFAKAAAGLDSYEAKLMHLATNIKTYRKAFYSIAQYDDNGRISNEEGKVLQRFMPGFSLENAKKEAKKESKEYFEAIMVGLQAADVDTTSEVGKQLIANLSKGIFDEFKILPTQMQDEFRNLFNEVTGLEFDDTYLRQQISDKTLSLINEAGGKIAEKIRNGEALDSAEKELLEKIKKQAVDEIGTNLPADLKTKLDGFAADNVWWLKIFAAFEPEQIITDWQKAMFETFGNNPEIVAVIKSAADPISALKAIADLQTKAQNVLNQNALILGITPQLNAPQTLDPNQYTDPVQKAAAEAWNKQAAALKAISNQNKYNISAFGKQSGSSGGSEGAKDDEFAEAVKERIKLLKNAKSEYESLAKSVGTDAASKELAQSPIFAGLKANKFLPEQAVPKTLAEYEKALNELQEKLTAKGLKTKQHRELNIEIEQVKLGIKKKKIDDALKLALDKVTKEAERQLADWNLFDKIRKATGNQDLAMSIAFGMNADATTDYPKLVREQFDEVYKAAQSVNKDLKDATFDSLTLEQVKLLPDELQKAWEEATKKLSQYAREQKDAIADILNEYQSLQDKLTKIDGKRQQDLDIVNRSNLGEPEKAVLRQRINVEADYKKFTQSNEYLQFFAGIYALTEQEATRIGDLIEQHLNRQLQAGAISAEDYYKEIERIRQQLDKLRNVKSDALTFATSGVKGINDKRKETNAAERLEKIQKIATLEDKLQKAREAGDIHQEVLLMAQLRGAKEELSLQDKIRDKIIQNEQQWQNVLGVANVASNIAGGLSDAFNSIKDMAAAFGADVDSGAWADITAVMDTLTTVTSGVQKVVQSAMSGDIGGILSGAVATITTPFTIWAQLHDKKLQKMIERSKEYSQQLQYINDAIERRMGSFLGNAKYLNTERMEQDRAKAKETEAKAQRMSHFKDDFFTKKAKEKSRKENEKYQARVKAMDEGGAYGYQRQLMTEQLAELEKQRQAEIDKKKTDNSVVADYDNQIDEMKVQIHQFAEETANAMYGIDLAGWSEQISDSIVDAFAKGEDAAEAFDRTVGDIMRSLVSKMINKSIFERMFNDVRNYLFGEDGLSGAFGKDFELDPTEAAQLGKMLQNIKKGIGDSQKLYDQVNELLGGALDDTESKSGLSAGIQNITEDTADLLASYVNAIRASVAMNEGRWERLLNDSIPQMNIVAEAQLAAQRQIAENTLRNAVAAEAIVKSNDEINRLLTRATQGGAKFYIH